MKVRSPRVSVLSSDRCLLKAVLDSEAPLPDDVESKLRLDEGASAQFIGADGGQSWIEAFDYGKRVPDGCRIDLLSGSGDVLHSVTSGDDVDSALCLAAMRSSLSSIPAVSTPVKTSCRKPIAGEIVYDADLSAFFVGDGSAWRRMP